MIRDAKLNKKEFIRFIKFGIVGCLNTGLNWFIFYLLNSIGVYYIISTIIAYSISVVHSYIWNSKWVFESKSKDKRKSSFKFIVLNFIGLLINSILMYVSVDIFKFEKMIGLIITTIIVMIMNYVVNKLWTFVE